MTDAERIAEEHGRQLLALERQEVERLQAIYRAARLEVLGRLSQVPAETFTAQHYRVALAQIEKGIAAIEQRLAKRWQGSVEGWLSEAVEQTLREIAVWEPTFRGAATGRIQLAALRKIAEPEGLLIDRFRTSLKSFSAGLRQEVRRRLSIHLAQRSAWREMSLDVAGRLRTQGLQGARWKAERIVRTEMVHALNAGHQAGLEAAAQELPDLRRQWDAHLDTRTSDVCRALDGHVRGIHDPWTFAGRKVMAPPAHPQCRSRLIPWRAAWSERGAVQPAA